MIGNKDYQLGPGSIIQPGNFGRLLKRYVAGSGQCVDAGRELAFEQIRTRGYLHKPSRLNACFGLPTTRVPLTIGEGFVAY